MDGVRDLDHIGDLPNSIVWGFVQTDERKMYLKRRFVWIDPSFIIS